MKISPNWLREFVALKADDRKLAAVSAHASQMDETFFTGMPPATFELAFGLEHFIRAYDTTDAPLPEDDLFVGLR